jgi:hypothetical protein
MPNTLKASNSPIYCMPRRSSEPQLARQCWVVSIFVLLTDKAAHTAAVRGLVHGVNSDQRWSGLPAPDGEGQSLIIGLFTARISQANSPKIDDGNLAVWILLLTVDFRHSRSRDVPHYFFIYYFTALIN